MLKYGFTKEMDIPYERVIEQAREALKKEGFSIKFWRYDCERICSGHGVFLCRA